MVKQHRARTETARLEAMREDQNTRQRKLASNGSIPESDDVEYSSSLLWCRVQGPPEIAGSFVVTIDEEGPRDRLDSFLKD